ncbi:MAG: hypothetical protein WA628_03795 [Terriglobales bacterium]
MKPEAASPAAVVATQRREVEVAMLCAELEHLEAEFDDIVNALENPNLTEREKQLLQEAYSQLSRTIKEHQEYGHEGGPCFEE